MNAYLDTAITAAVGLSFYVAALVVVARVSHVHLVREIVERRNPAVATLVLSGLVGLAILLAAVAPRAE